MKKILGFLTIILSICLVACNFFSFTVTFKDYDGKIIDEHEYLFGETVVVPSVAKREGYKFIGWDKQIEYTVYQSNIYTAQYEKLKDGETTSGTISFHFIDLEVASAGDAIYIKAGDNDILIDSGSSSSSASVIKKYVDKYCTDGLLEYVICTHGDSDHITGFAQTNNSLFDLYDMGIFIDSPKTTKETKIYSTYLSERDARVAKGTIHYSALECYNEENGAKRTYTLDTNITMTFLYNYYYDHSTTNENDYSVCVLFSDTLNDKHILLTGDLEKSGETKLVEYNTLPLCDVFKAGHHGSETASNDVLLDVIKPGIVVASSVAGRPEYTYNIDNIFPSTAFINRVSKHTEKIYCTAQYKDGAYAPLNGSVIITYDNGNENITCTNSSVVLKDSEWFNSEVSYYMKGEAYMLPRDETPTGTRKWRTWPE